MRMRIDRPSPLYHFDLLVAISSMSDGASFGTKCKLCSKDLDRVGIAYLAAVGEDYALQAVWDRHASSCTVYMSSVPVTLDAQGECMEAWIRRHT